MKVLVIDGVIGQSFGGITAKQFRDMLPKTKEDIKILINSPGGSVIDGFDIFDQITMYQGKVELIFGAIAASAAAYIGMSVPKENRKAFENSGFMMHESKGAANGRSRDLKIIAQRLEGINNIIAQATAKGTGREYKEIKKSMTEDFYLNGWEELSNYGIISDIVNKEYFANDEFIYPPEGNIFDFLFFGKALEQSADARKELVLALDDKMAMNAEGIQKEMAAIAALDESFFAKCEKEEKTGENNGNRIDEEKTQKDDQENNQEHVEKDSTEKQKENSAGLTSDENKIKGEHNQMAKLEDLLRDNPDAKAEYDAALVSAKADGISYANKNTSEILAIEGVKISAEAASALDAGVDPKEYAYSKLKAEAAKREEKPKTPIFSSLATAQTPMEQAQEKPFDAKSFEDGIKNAASKMFPAKGGK